MTKKSSKTSKFVALMMSLILLVTMGPISAYAETGANVTQGTLSDPEITEITGDMAAAENAAVLTDTDVPEFIAVSDLVTRGTVRRVYEEETDLSTILFENNDGTRTLYLYGVPVKYVAPDGTTRDKSTAISTLSGLQTLWNGTALTLDAATMSAQDVTIGRLDLGTAADALSLMNDRMSAAYGNTLNLSDMAYATLDSDIRSLYPTAVSDGVVLNYGDYSIRTIPIAENSPVLPGAANVAECASLTDDEVRTRVRYGNAFGLGTILQYTPTTMGVKEEIILTSHVGKNSFLFRVETGGLTIEEADGRYFFVDPETQRVIAQLGEIIAYDSNGQIARGAISVQSVIAGQRYNVTISVGSEFLAGATYPVSIDPTTTIGELNYYGTLIEDNAVYSDAGAWNYTFEAFHYVGAVDYTPAGESYAGQALYRFPALYNASLCTDYCNLPSASIHSFVLHLKTGLVDSDTTLYVNPYVPSWQSSTRICDASYYNYIDISRYNIAVPNVPSSGNFQVDITDIVREWSDVYHQVSDYTLANWSSGIAIRNADPTKLCILTAIEESSEVYATLDYSPYGGTCYLNSASTRTFLGGADGSSGDSVFLESGVMANIGDDVAWTFQYVGNSRFYIQSTAQPSLYIGSTGRLTTTAFAWTMTIASGGGVHIYRIDSDTGAILYLGVNSSGNIVASRNLSGDQIKWRKVPTGDYRELSLFTAGDLSLALGECDDVDISLSSSAHWVSANDFYIETDSAVLDTCGTTVFTYQPGTAQAVVTHLPTGLSDTITISSQNSYSSTHDDCPYVDEIINVDNTLNALSVVGNNASALSGATWVSTNTDVATVNSYGVVTGVDSGFSYILAYIEDGEIFAFFRIRVRTEDDVLLESISTEHVYYVYYTLSQLQYYAMLVDEADVQDLHGTVFEIKLDIYRFVRNRRYVDFSDFRSEYFEEFGVSITNDDVKVLVSEYECALSGLYTPLNVCKQYIGVFNHFKELIEFYGFSIACQIDNVNVAGYREVSSAEADVSAAYQRHESLTSAARQAQMNGKYEPDTFMTKILKRGDKVYRLCNSSTDLAQGAWYTNYDGPASVNFDYTATCNGLQVDDWGRYKLAEYVVTNDIYVAYGTTAANGNYGSGGFTQFFIPSY